MSRTPATSESPLTPMMQQYQSVKERYPGHLIFFRMGDFYEMFGEDAIEGAQLLGITLTKRPHGKNGEIPLAGVPHHQAERYLAMLAEAGRRVVVCDQMEDPRLAKGVVKRDVTEIITPGTVINPSALDDIRTPAIAAICGPDDRGHFGIARAEAASGRFAVESVTPEALVAFVGNLDARELIVAADADERLRALGGPTLEVTVRPAWQFETAQAAKTLKDHFGVRDLTTVGVIDEPVGIAAAGALLAYLKETKRAPMAHITHVDRLTDRAHIALDAQTALHLDVVSERRGGPPTLMTVMDRCRTSMGRRLLRHWLTTPLTDMTQIQKRQDAVGFFVDDRAVLAKATDALKGVGDVERLVGRLGSERVTPRDMVGLREALDRWPNLATLLNETAVWPDDSPSVADTSAMARLLAAALVEDPPVHHTGGGIFRRGHSEELDGLRDGSAEARSWIAALQGRLRNETGIASLKVGYNKIFDYYIEVPKTQSSRIPDAWMRKQTLVAAERYITTELKEKEDVVLTTDERAAELESRLFVELRARLTESMPVLIALAQAMAHIDVTASLAQVALARGYVRPTLTRERTLSITGGRHPILETINPAGGFVPNETAFDDRAGWLHLITGPNMAGKSTYLRQVGLIVLLAQTGSYVPADAARIGIVDRIFTRVGADDELSRNRSTFMVEMTETARILRGMTPRSLVLFDEVGRGTSTYDGVAIAWAIGEHLAHDNELCPRTLFATHYHELTALADHLPAAANYQMAVREKEGTVAFLFRVRPGACDDSFGIHVAALAGVPPGIVGRARDILTALETGSFEPLRRGYTSQPRHRTARSQPDLFSAAQRQALQSLAAVTPEEMTPIEALNTLAELARGLRTRPGPDVG